MAGRRRRRRCIRGLSQSVVESSSHLSNAQERWNTHAQKASYVEIKAININGHRVTLANRLSLTEFQFQFQFLQSAQTGGGIADGLTTTIAIAVCQQRALL